MDTKALPVPLELRLKIYSYVLNDIEYETGEDDPAAFHFPDGIPSLALINHTTSKESYGVLPKSAILRIYQTSDLQVLVAKGFDTSILQRLSMTDTLCSSLCYQQLPKFCRLRELRITFFVHDLHVGTGTYILPGVKTMKRAHCDYLSFLKRWRNKDFPLRGNGILQFRYEKWGVKEPEATAELRFDWDQDGLVDFQEDKVTIVQTGGTELRSAQNAFKQNRSQELMDSDSWWMY